MSSSSSSTKRFFKVILCSTLHDHKLRIPDKFVQKYGDELSDSVRLTVPTGGICCVKVEKIDKTIWLHEGMQKFMEDQSIQSGYFLIFKYKGNSTFQVRIFDLSTLEIEYPYSSDSGRLNDACDSESPDDANQLPVSDQHEDDDDDGHHGKSGGEDDNDDSSLEIWNSSTSSGFTSGNKRTPKRWERKRCYITRSKKLKIQDDGGIKATGVHDSTSPRRNRVHQQSNGSMHYVKADKPVLVSSGEANRTITSSSKRKNSSVTAIGSKISRKPEEVHVNPEIQVANISLPKNPVYWVTMKPYNISKNIMPLPTEFARLYMCFTSNFIKLQDADDNEWEVRCTTTKGAPCLLSQGWKDFVKAKKLMAGDICIFEPVRINENIKLKVKITRAV